MFEAAFTGASQRCDPAPREGSHSGSSLLLGDGVVELHTGAGAHTHHRALLLQPPSIDTASLSGQGEEWRPRKVQSLLKVTPGRCPSIEQDDWLRWPNHHMFWT